MSWPPRILHVIDRLDGYGRPRMLQRVAAQQAAEGSDVSVIALGAPTAGRASLHGAGVQTHLFPRRGAWDAPAWARLAWVLFRTNVDVIHAWHGAAAVAATLLRGRGISTPILATVGPSDRRGWTNAALRRCARRVTRLAAVDEATRDWLKQLEVSSDRIKVIRPGVEAPSPPQRDRTAWLEELGIPESAPLIAVAAPLVRSRAIDETIWNFELVRVLYPDARLLVAGDGPDRYRLERFASQVSEPGFVRFLGYRDDLRDLLAHVDVYWQLNPSATTPWTLLEALAAGVPVVAADVPAHRVVMAPALADWLTLLGGRAAVARATDEILRDPAAARHSAGEASRHILGEWSLDAAIDAYRELYQSAAAPAATRK